MPLTVVGHGVDKAIAERGLLLRGTRQGGVGIEGTIRANPIATRFITIDEIRAFW